MTRGASGLMGLTEHRDLRSGETVWEPGKTAPGDPTPDTVDIAIVGGGIVAAILAERFASLGRSVAVIDRREPAHGSTAASTAQVMCAMDTPLGELVSLKGEAQAAQIWRRVQDAVANFSARIDSLGIACEKQQVPTLCLEGDVLDAAALEQEGALRRSHGLPYAFLTAEQSAERFGISPRAGLVCDIDFEVDPAALTLGLFAAARAHHATITFPADVVALHAGDATTRLDLADGRSLEARDVILATGYERPLLFLPPAFSLLSTFVIATAPGVALPNEREAMIWEAADPYLYVRADRDGRIIAGGEDIEADSASRRDALMDAKSGAILAQLHRLFQREDIEIERRWSAAFGSSPDSLPAIGAAANLPRTWMAYGYGGNGIAFAALAAEILEGLITGKGDGDAAAFSPYRFA